MKPALPGRLPLLTACLAVTILAGCRQTDTNAQTEPAGSQPAQHETLASGRFVDKGGQHTAGGYRIERAGGNLRLVLDEDFRTDEGPDLHVVLSPEATDAAANDNALAGGAAMVVAPLSSQEGSQTYDLPDDTDLARFQSVLIHCIRFSHLYGAAPMQVGMP